MRNPTSLTLPRPFARSLVAAAIGLAATVAPAAALLSAVRAGFYTEGQLFLLEPANDDEFGSALAVGDFNRDGVDDLATGIPNDNNVGNLYPHSGIVLIRYGVAGQGLASGAASQVLSQAFGGSPDPAEEDDLFGLSMAVGDFDGDGADDLAVGIPGEDNPDDFDSGAVQVYYGSFAGLSLDGVQYFDEDTSGIPGSTHSGDEFGAALAAADFDGDGFADLAIGVPWEGDGILLGDHFFHGSVNVLYGASGGLTTSGAQRFTQDDPGMDGANEDFDHFGSSLASADIDGDGYDDLTVGVIGENDGGGVHFIFGSGAGLDWPRNNLFTQDDAGVFDTDEPNDQFGYSLAAADFNGDGYADVAVGVPLEDFELPGGGVISDAGAFHLFFGNEDGISSSDFWMFTSTSTTLGASENGDRWSRALAAGNFDADGYADLAVGAHAEGLGGFLVVGEVTILRGYADGVTPAGGQVWNQNSPGVPDANEQGDQFGRALAVGDFDATGYVDLAVGAPRESTVAYGDGAEWVLYGSLFADGFESGGTTVWSATFP